MLHGGFIQHWAARIDEGRDEQGGVIYTAALYYGGAELLPAYQMTRTFGRYDDALEAAKAHAWQVEAQQMEAKAARVAKNDGQPWAVVFRRGERCAHSGFYPESVARAMIETQNAKASVNSPAYAVVSVVRPDGTVERTEDHPGTLAPILL